MAKSLSNTKKGFTIIEVLIVLAIAGLILLIVFLAVPALQRNSRNTQRTEDASRILGAAQEVINNNNGQTTAVTAANVTAAAGNLAFYTGSYLTVTAGPAVVTNSTTKDTMVLYKAAKCSSMTNGMGAVSDGPTSRKMALTFSVETGNGTALRCQES